MDIITFEVPYGNEVLKFQLQPMRRKTTMRIVHTFLGELRSNNLDITAINFDILENIANELFKKGFVVLPSGDSKELTDHSDFFFDKIDVFYSALTEGVKNNSPDFFNRTEN